MKRTIGIVGGGAAGMTAAIAAARAGGEVTLIERNDRLGKKILSTGNGKCNLGNEELSVEHYYTRSPEVLRDCLGRFGTKETVRFFESIGLMVKSRNGYLYPVCEQASAVLDVLRYAAASYGVKVVTGCRTEQIERDPRTGKISVAGGAGLEFDRLILACGGCAAPGTGSDGSGFKLAGQLGHGLVPPVPALVQLRCREDFMKALAGVRTDARLTLRHRRFMGTGERGELLLTDYGISGIPVFQLSRVVNYILSENGKKAEVEIAIDFLPDYTEASFARLCEDRELLMGERTVEEFFTGMLHKKLMMLFIKLAGLKPGERVSEADKGKLQKVYGCCRQLCVHVTGSNPFTHAQVCAGGVPLEEVTEKLESRMVPGVYFAGEILDVDGKCGGYNLQWAWCSGHIAGLAAAE